MRTMQGGNIPPWSCPTRSRLVAKKYNRGVLCLLVKKDKKQDIQPLPFFKTVEQMSTVCGLGANKLRQLMDKGELEYLPNGSHRLLTDRAIWDYYERAKIYAHSKTKGGDNS